MNDDKTPARVVEMNDEGENPFANETAEDRRVWLAERRYCDCGAIVRKHAHASTCGWLATDHDKWRLTPIQVLVRALERVQAGTHSTAIEAIGVDSARDAQNGSPITQAWGLLLQSFGSTVTREGMDASCLAYHTISDFGQKPDQAGEVQALERAIDGAKNAPAQVREFLARGKAVTAGQIVTETGITWSQVDEALLSFGDDVVRIPTSPECFVLREFLEP